MTAATARPRGPRKVLAAVRVVLLSAVGTLQQTVMPVMLAIAVYVAGGQTWLLFGGLSVALATFVALVVPVGRWMPRWLVAIPVLSLAAIPLAVARWGIPHRALPAPGAMEEWLVGGMMWAVAAWFAWNLLRVRRGARPWPGPALDLALPLGPGRYVVLQGGSSRLMNRHLVTLEKAALSSIRGQGHGVDIVAQHRGGLVARNPLSFRAEDYAIFGAQVRSPVHGQVLAAHDGAEDHDLLTTDRDAPLGNHVWLSVDDAPGGPALLLLAHLRHGSLRVRVGKLSNPAPCWPRSGIPATRPNHICIYMRSGRGHPMRRWTPIRCRCASAQGGNWSATPGSLFRPERGRQPAAALAAAVGAYSAASAAGDGRRHCDTPGPAHSVLRIAGSASAGVARGGPS